MSQYQHVSDEVQIQRIRDLAADPNSQRQALAIAFGWLLRRERLATGLTQQHLELCTGIQRPIIGRIERGLHRPELDTINRYCLAVGADARDIIEVAFTLTGLA